MAEPLAQLNFPPEWLGEKSWLPGFPEIVEAYTYDKLPNEQFFVAGGVIDDGTNLIGLAWSSGQHIARCGPPLWALEERVDPNAPPPTRVLWKQLVGAVLRGHREAKAEWHGVQWREPRPVKAEPCYPPNKAPKSCPTLPEESETP